VRSDGNFQGNLRGINIYLGNWWEMIIFASHFSEEMNQDLKQEALDRRYLRMASIWAENSYCQRRKVGAIIVKNSMIISDGYNGTPSGFENVCEDSNGVTKPYVLHAEANAISKVARSNNSSDGATLYITASPCMECSKLIIQAGIKRVVYNELYRITDGLDLLHRAGIECVHIPDLNPEQ
jgi:dCMP deaminase